MKNILVSTDHRFVRLMMFMEYYIGRFLKINYLQKNTLI